MRNLQDIAELGQRQAAAELPILARCIMARGRGTDGIDPRRTPERVQRLLKTAVPAGTTSSVEGMVDLQIVSSAFTASLSNEGAFDAVYLATVRVPMQLPGIRILTSTFAAAASTRAR